MPRDSRSIRAHFLVCARVLMTSLAANNILPLRIGDIMRVFTYAGDLGASPSVILSTVILEKLLDIFVLVLLFVATVGRVATPHLASSQTSHSPSPPSDSSSFSSRPAVCNRPSSASSPACPKSQARKNRTLDHSSLSTPPAASASSGRSSFFSQTAIIWTCEGMIFVSAIPLLGIPVDRIAPWLAVSFANLSYLIPSSPGAIGPFELAVKTSLVNHGAPSQAAIFGLAIHAWMLVSVTGAGGIIFLIHRIRIHNHEPLLDEIEQLPAELP